MFRKVHGEKKWLFFLHYLEEIPMLTYSQNFYIELIST